MTILGFFVPPIPIVPPIVGFLMILFLVFMFGEQLYDFFGFYDEKHYGSIRRIHWEDLDVVLIYVVGFAVLLFLFLA